MVQIMNRCIERSSERKRICLGRQVIRLLFRTPWGETFQERSVGYATINSWGMGGFQSNNPPLSVLIVGVFCSCHLLAYQYTHDQWIPFCLIENFLRIGTVNQTVELLVESFNSGCRYLTVPILVTKYLSTHFHIELIVYDHNVTSFIGGFDSYCGVVFEWAESFSLSSRQIVISGIRCLDLTYISAHKFHKCGHIWVSV